MCTVCIDDDEASEVSTTHTCLIEMVIFIYTYVLENYVGPS